jgi:hypothetical protein
MPRPVGRSTRMLGSLLVLAACGPAAQQSAGPLSADPAKKGTADRSAAVASATAAERMAPSSSAGLDGRSDAVGDVSNARFSDPEAAVLVSGPPGGTLLLLTRRYDANAHGEAALERLVRLHFHRRGFSPLVLGKPTRVVAAGEPRVALPLVAGEGQARAQWCAALIPVIGSRTMGVFAVAGVSASGGAQPDCAAVVSHPQIAPVWKTLKVSEPTPRD